MLRNFGSTNIFLWVHVHINIVLIKNCSNAYMILCPKKSVYTTDSYDSNSIIYEFKSLQVKNLFLYGGNFKSHVTRF
jgi:hypothetical protein